MEQQDRYIRFDWAVKRLLRQKTNFGVLEGFLTILLGEEVKILELPESESNQQTAEEKFNRVDIKALNSKGEIIIVEIQNIFTGCIRPGTTAPGIRGGAPETDFPQHASRRTAGLRGTSQRHHDTEQSAEGDPDGRGIGRQEGRDKGVVGGFPSLSPC